MMLKKIAAVLLISIANFILLAHIIVPHHHHKSEVCLINSHCENDSHAHEHEFNDHDQEHDGNPESDYCLLKQLVLLPTQRTALDINESDLLVYSDQSDLFLLKQILFAPKAFGLKTGQHKPPLLYSNNYSLFITSGQGLRAPPVA